MKIQDVKRKHPVEDELFDICIENDLVLFTDDIKAIKEFEDKIDCYFSVHMVYLLFKKGIISEYKALLAIETMKNERDWKRNVIVAAAKALFF